MGSTSGHDPRAEAEALGHAAASVLESDTQHTAEDAVRNALWKYLRRLIGGVVALSLLTNAGTWYVSTHSAKSTTVHTIFRAIQDERYHNALAACVDQNAKHDGLLKAIDAATIAGVAQQRPGKLPADFVLRAQGQALNPNVSVAALDAMLHEAVAKATPGASPAELARLEQADQSSGALSFVIDRLAKHTDNCVAASHKLVQAGK